MKRGATLKGLFDAYMKEPSRLPPEHQAVWLSVREERAVDGQLRRQSWRTMWREMTIAACCRGNGTSSKYSRGS